MQAPTNAHVWHCSALVRLIVHGCFADCLHGCFADCTMQCRIAMHSMFLQEWGNKGKLCMYQVTREACSSLCTYGRLCEVYFCNTNSHPFQSQSHEQDEALCQILCQHNSYAKALGQHACCAYFLPGICMPHSRRF